MEAFAKDLNVDELSNTDDDVECCILKWNNIVTDAMDKHAPMKSKRVPIRERKLWFTESLNQHWLLVRWKERN